MTAFYISLLFFTYLLNLPDSVSGCCCCDCCCCNQQMMDVNGTMIPMGGGCGCGGGSDALLAALLGRRRRRAVPDQNGFIELPTNTTRKMKRNGGFRIFGPTEEEQQQMKQQNQPQNPRFLAVPPSQLKMKKKKQKFAKIQ